MKQILHRTHLKSIRFHLRRLWACPEMKSTSKLNMRRKKSQDWLSAVKAFHPDLWSLICCVPFPGSLDSEHQEDVYPSSGRNPQSTSHRRLSPICTVKQASAFEEISLHFSFRVDKHSTGRHVNTHRPVHRHTHSELLFPFGVTLLSFISPSFIYLCVFYSI